MQDFRFEAAPLVRFRSCNELKAARGFEEAVPEAEAESCRVTSQSRIGRSCASFTLSRSTGFAAASSPKSKVSLPIRAGATNKDMSRYTNSSSGETDRTEELDGAHGSKRQAIDRDVEARIHRGKNDPEHDHDAAVSRVESAVIAPGPAPDGEDDRRAGDSQPGDAERDDLGE